MKKNDAKANKQEEIAPPPPPEPIDWKTLLEETRKECEANNLFSKLQEEQKQLQLASAFDPMTLVLGDPRDTLELHMAHLNISHIHPNIRKCCNIEVLWLNHNSLQSLDQLVQVPEFHQRIARPVDQKLANYGCTRIKCLYAHNNKITSLEQSSIKYLAFLEVLSLHDNELKDLQTLLQQMKHLQCLKELDLFNNPVAKEVNYRLRVIATFPSLELLDHHVVSTEERNKAVSYGQQNVISKKESTINPIAFGKIVPDEVLNFKPKRVMEVSWSVQDLQKQVQAVQKSRSLQNISD